MSALNYRHLYYFWVVAKEGGMARAAQRLDIAIQTISSQVRELEKSLGHQLLKPQGRGLALTEAGEAAYARAEEIFEIGQRIPREVADAAAGPAIRLSIGLSDGLSKLAAHSLLDPVLQTPGLRLLCHEGEFEHLMADLALHRLDLVLTGQGAPVNANLRLSSHWLVSSPVSWYGPGQWVSSATCATFPDCLNELPVLLPTRDAPVRAALERWFDDHHLVPEVVGEFEDSALMSVFAARGLGVFPVSALGAQDLSLMPGLSLLGQTDVKEDIHAIYSHRTRHHPLVQKLFERVESSGD
ncbi:MAG: LysR family transcriptional regulator [Limnohabitans sp.]